MARVKRGVTAHARHKKILKAAKGYYGAFTKKGTTRVPFSNQIFSHLTDIREQP